MPSIARPWRLLPVLLLVLLAPLGGLAPAALAATLSVCPSGCPYDQIQPALDEAQNGDTISVAAGTYAGWFTIAKNVTLLGAGAGKTIISGGGPVVVVGSGATASILDVTISGGSSPEGGGGIANVGTLMLANSAISGNSATIGDSYYHIGSPGGGILNSGTLTVINSTLIDNGASADGGGIFNSSGSTMTVTDSTVIANGAVDGGGIANSGTVTVTNSILIANGGTNGGGIFNDPGSTLALSNSTLSLNTANRGGGIFNDAGSTVTVTNSTLSDNRGYLGAGGIANSGTVTAGNTLVAGNTVGSSAPAPDCYGSLTDGVGHNLIGIGDGCGLTNGANGDQIGSAAQPLDPKLGPHQSNGGPTQTMALLAGSPAVGGGDATTCAALVGPDGVTHDTDQRGAPRHSAARGACDIGAYDTGGTDSTSTTVSASPTPVTFGQPVTLTATVARVVPGAGTPIGTVTFTDHGVLLGTVPLDGRQPNQARLTTSDLPPGIQAITATYGGDTHSLGSQGSLSGGLTVGCDRTITGTVGSVVVSSGATCLMAGADVQGSVTLRPGAALASDGATVQGSVQSRGARALLLCGTTLGGLDAVGTTGQLRMGDGSDQDAPACAADKITGSVEFDHNTGSLELGGATVGGSVTLQGNQTHAAGAEAAEAAPELEGNQIGGGLSCRGNRPAPTNDGQSNHVTGARSGQCAAPGF